MEGKVSAVVGDISKERLGMDPSTFTSLATKLDIIVNSAGTTTFDERWDGLLIFFLFVTLPPNNLDYA